MKAPQPEPSPRALLDLATAYQQSKVLFALVEFGLPTMLASAPHSTAEVAEQLHLHPRAADRLLHAGVALGLLQKEAGLFCNAPLAAEFLVQNKESYLGDQLLGYDRVSYPLWSDLTAKLRDWQPAATDNEVPQEEDQGAEALSAMHNLAVLTGRALGQAYDFSPHRLMLDLGGGTGAMSIGICQQHPHLRAQVYDLPHIVDTAQEFIAAAGLRERIATVAGNFKEDKLPDGYDVVLLANFLSVASEETNRALLRQLYEQLPDGGAVILSGWILADTRTSPLISVLFCLEDINWGAPDVERSAATYEEWLRAAGFVDIHGATYYAPTSMIVGRKREPTT
ncbi:MAG TPA: methyltransferase [Blastocatellia bacterium]|nr:methyltransferase [Blastocatellia bacterium]